MYQPVVLFIGLRYVCARSLDRFNRLVFWLSSLGITIGVFSLIIVLSVMNGFQIDLESNILGLIPHALITSKTGSINPKELPTKMIKLPGVTHIEPLTTSNVVIQSATNISIGVMVGINPNEQYPLVPFLVNTQQSSLQPGKYKIILGQRYADELNVKIGDHLYLIVPSVNQFTPIGRVPSQRIFTVAGTYNTNNEIDNYQIIVNQKDASNIMHYPSGNITGWRLWLKNPLYVDNINIKLKELPAGLVWKDWRENKGALFQAVRMEKNMMGLLLSLIIVVAVFNIITSINLLIIEKQAEIAILQVQGLTYYQIIAVFMIQGASSSIIGTSLGTLVGILLTSQLHNLMPTILGSFLNIKVTLPVQINYYQVISIILISISIALLATFYPSWRAAAIQPAEALRYA
ncbi:lipoprotein-releasing ABC transporter permease subunit LolC [Candidatus Pantoea carbekii]|uniref:LolC protein n=1 Tax=Candidatus Pantoea carbekii TaxID=1235990 RepID=U3U8I3_9GAMM|nr:lipoprotein-releasing ABC transporter permease subunit LolC [Candidatus Pantoea carbekii]AKC32123.1 lipoprotein-releasing system transmembrane protein LolC [Candidatus Pantoea carbekii]BAO00649.1 LolC protein [Candidatus Pantoea carbekii]